MVFRTLMSVLLSVSMSFSSLPSCSKESEKQTDGPAVAQVLWTESNRTLTFLCSPTVYKKGDLYGGQTITGVWSGEEVTGIAESPGWSRSEEQKAVIDQSFSEVRPKNLSYWFSSIELESIEGLEYLNTSEATDMSGMFDGCMKLETLDVSHFDTSKVTDMMSMFAHMNSLKELDLSGFNTSNVTHMGCMFEACWSLTSLDLGSFDTSKVTAMSRMFYFCSGLHELDLTGFDTSSVENAIWMFCGCSGLETLDLSSFDMRKADLDRRIGTFSGCNLLEKIFCLNSDSAWPVSGEELDVYADGMKGYYGDTVIDGPEIPEGTGLKSAKLGGYFTPKYMHISFDANGGTGEMEEKDFYSAFYDAGGTALPKNLFAKENGAFLYWNTEADGSGTSYADGAVIAPKEDLTLYAQWKDVSDHIAQAVWTEGSKTLTLLYTPHEYKAGDTYNGETVTGVWSGEEVLACGEDAPAWNAEADFETLVFDESFRYARPRSTANWCRQAGNGRTVIGLENLNTGEVTTMFRMFADSDLSSVDLTTLDTSNVVSMGAMFENCTAVTSLDLSFFDVSSLEDTSRMFFMCGNLKELNLKGWNAPNLKSAGMMFYECSSLESLDLSTLNSTGLLSTWRMFDGCANLTTLDVSGFTLTVVEDPHRMFEYCKGLKTIYCLDSDTEWTGNVDPEYGENWWVFESEDLVGRYGDEEVHYVEGIMDLNLGKSAKLGGYFTPKYMRISFDANGGTGEMEPAMPYSSFYDRKGSKLPGNTLTREGFRFKGWNTEADGSGTYYEDGAVIAPSEDLVLYAQWRDESLWKWSRFAGEDRYETMAMAVKEAYEDASCKTLLLTSGQSFPDALTGSALAGVYECPVLLTKSGTLVPEAQEEIRRLAAPGCKVLILGGEGTVTPGVEKAVQALGIDGLTTERVAGDNREGTAIEVYKKCKAAEGFRAGGTVIIATGYDYADVLSISPYAYASKTPILLAKKNGSLSDEIKALLEEEGFRKAIIIGGTGSVSEVAEDWLKGLGMAVLRLQGSGRYATSAEILHWELGYVKSEIQPEVTMTTEGMGVATGTGFPDALGSVSLLGRTASPLLLAADNNKANAAETRENISRLIGPHTKDMTKAYIFGGTGTVSRKIEDWLNDAVE